MRMFAILRVPLVLVTFLVFHLCSCDNNNNSSPPTIMVGQWKDVPLTTNNKNLLYTAISSVNAYPSKNSTHLCLTHVNHVQEQVVNGIFYRYQVEGCPIQNEYLSPTGSCVVACKKPKEYEVELYTQAWTSTLIITNIHEIHMHGGKKKKSEDNEEEKEEQPSNNNKRSIMEMTEMTEMTKRGGNLSKEEIKKIDQWIQANHLNVYGDPADTIYLGGTPLFDERTNKQMTRYEYILKNHPDRPWNHGKGSIFTCWNLSVYTIFGFVLFISMFILMKRYGNRSAYSSELRCLSNKSNGQARYKYDRLS